MSYPHTTLTATLAAALLTVGASAGAATAASPATFFSPSAYLSEAHIPAGFYASGYSFLDNLEDDNLGGSLTASAGSVISNQQFSGLIDSVDADDGSIDGSGGAGHSWFYGSGSTGVTFTFQGAQLPTAFGLVWTDGAGSVTFSARDGAGTLLGSTTVGGFADSSFGGTTAEDRFFGVQYAGGVKSITISNSSGGIEVDHLQYGAMAAAVPEPETYAMLLAGLGLMGAIARRRRNALPAFANHATGS